MPFGFLRRRKPDGAATGSSGMAGVEPARGPATDERADLAETPGAAADAPTTPEARGVPFIAITEDWRLRGRMQIPGRLTDALNKREAIGIADVHWGPADGSGPLVPAPGIRSVDPYDLILVIAGEESLSPLTEAERTALATHKVPYDVALEMPPFHVTGTVYLHPGSEPERLLDRSNEMFTPVGGAVALLAGVEISDPQVEVILVNRFYLRGVKQVDRGGSAPGLPRPGGPTGDGATP